VRVAEDQRAPRADAVDVLLPFDVDHFRAEAFHEKPRRAADRAKRAHGGIDAAGQHGFGPLEEMIVRRHG
jgi:hypothetical protein